MASGTGNGRADSRDGALFDADHDGDLDLLVVHRDSENLDQNRERVLETVRGFGGSLNNQFRYVPLSLLSGRVRQQMGRGEFFQLFSAADCAQLEEKNNTAAEQQSGGKPERLKKNRSQSEFRHWAGCCQGKVIAACRAPAPLSGF